MAIIFKNFREKIINLGPLILLYFFSISEVDAQFSNLFEILSFNLQLIIVYYWMLKDSSILGHGHVFFAGIINDVVMGLPIGISSITYLVVAFFASYVKNVTVNTSLFSDWFTFFIAIFFANLFFYILLNNFSLLTINYIDLFYNSFFTILFYPALWLIFNIYKNLMVIRYDD